MNEISIEKIKLAADNSFMKKIFNQRLRNYFPGTKLFSLVTKIEKNSFNRHFLISYTLFLIKNSRRVKKVIKGKTSLRINNPFDCPKRAYFVSKYLWDHGFKNKIPRPVDYLPPLHLFLYEEAKGESLENELGKRKKSALLNYAPDIANLLRKIHQIKLNELKIKLINKNRFFEKKQNLHYLDLFKKFNSSNYQKFKKILGKIEKLRDQNKEFFLPSKNFCLTHGDFHPGNVLIDKNRIKFLDFGSVGLADPLSDVGNFLMQSELMLRLHFPLNYLRIFEKLNSKFLKNYFNQPLTNVLRLRILYYEIRCLIQIMAVISLVQYKDPKRQKKSISVFFEVLENHFNKFQKLIHLCQYEKN